MMKKKKTRKRLLFLLITLLTLFNNTSYVEAKYGGGSVAVSTDDVGSCDAGPAAFHACDADAGWTATCNKSIEYKEYNYVYPNVWDMYGNYLGEDIDVENSFAKTQLKGVLAGTYLGLNLYEEKFYSIEVSVGSIGIQEYHTCTYSCEFCGYVNKGGKSVYECHTETKGPYEGAGTECPSIGSCTLTQDKVSYKCRETCTAALEKCKAKHKPTKQELYSSYNGQFSDSNDINNRPMEPLESEVIYHEVDEHDGEWYWYIGETKRFAFKLGSACINAKTGEVRYIGENGNCNLSNDEYSVDENSEYWKYFIPLNANSANDIYIDLVHTNDGMISAETCKDIISNHPDEYTNLIKPSTGQFTGDAEIDKQNIVNQCYWEMSIKIPVIQRFYNELENGINFKGFNFYYKPIDISNPFPNGLNNTSIWHDWNKSNPDISKSFDKVTYSAKTSGNEDKIRDYNKNNPYTSWENMNINGTSNFIKNEGIVTGSGNLNSFYNLGCGPGNTSSQPECGRR